jgi:hypothetical protein
MENVFARWLPFLFTLQCLLCDFSLFCCDVSPTCWTEDETLSLSEDESEHLVAMTGELQLIHFHNGEGDNAESRVSRRWILKLDSESFDVACKTPVRAPFQTPASIRSSRNGNQMELTGDYNTKWLYDHLGQPVTVKGYLWHAHTGHHFTPVMMDLEPWLE